MTLNILPIDEAQAHIFLRIAGILDFVVAILLFIPKTVKPALWYSVIWGSLTALARVVANFSIEFPMDTFGFWLWETIFRLPHGLIPLVTLWILGSGWWILPKRTSELSD